MGTVPVTLTAYWPTAKQLTAAQRLMEGGLLDRKDRPVITLQQHQADPVKYPYVSCAGDFTFWPDGQRIRLPDIDPNAVFRVVDTGGHFANFTDSNGVKHTKVWRNAGHEPIDVCVDGPNYNIGPRLSVAYVVDGDNWDGKPSPQGEPSEDVPPTGEKPTTADTSAESTDTSETDHEGPSDDSETGDAASGPTVGMMLFGVAVVGGMAWAIANAFAKTPRRA